MSRATPVGVTTFERAAKTLDLPWPFTGREDELDVIRRSVAAGRPGIVVTAPAGRGKTRLAAEAVRGLGCTRVTGTPDARRIPFAAFAHLLPEAVTLHRAVQLLAGVRLLLVDDAHLLDDDSAALVHQLAVHGRTRLLVVAVDDGPVPAAVSRLWTGELLPRLPLEPLPAEETGRLMEAGAGGPLEPLTANRLYALCRGDLRLLRDLLGALRDGGLLPREPESDVRSWRGPVPLTPTLRERAAAVLDRAVPEDRDTLDRLAFAEPLAPHMDTLDLAALERLEGDGLVSVAEDGGVRLVHPLHGPALRSAAGRLRTARLVGATDRCAAALDAEQAALARRIEDVDVRDAAGPVGEWLVHEGRRVPAGYAAVRARLGRLRGELRDAAAWAREGLRGAPGDPACRAELALAGDRSGEAPVPRAPVGSDALGLYEAVRRGVPEQAAGPLSRLPGAGAAVLARHAHAAVRGDGPALDLVARELEGRGLLLFAAEASAQAAGAHRDPRAARGARTRAVELSRRCQGARTPALSGLVLGELTDRQRQIVTLAAAGMTNRQIAEKLTLSVRTVGNHLYSAYTRLGASDRAALPCLVDPLELPQARTA
ncbi:LuxR C-terminal-related transcriptional regulator [Streptomyces sp. NPDC090306]|uniref:LuxR family transcriptional regulator AbsR2 n=1 Tax=Streptomyces sp. NPDC090306 TaxID=3365961 RepID=UPI00380AE99A